jgi:hypothetical protein
MPTAEQSSIDWLLTANEPWVRYNALVDLAGAFPDSPEVRDAYAAMQAHPEVSALISAIDTWPEKPLGKAYDPKDAIWKLGMLADFGLQKDDERIASIAERVFGAQGEDGGFLHGGFDHTKSWHTRPYICVSHVMTYALARFGYLDDPRVQRAYEQLEQWRRLDGGWHPNKLNLPGNEREADPSCPFGTVNVLKAVIANPALRGSETAKAAAEFLLTAWARRGEPYRPVGFGIGASWDKTQYPLVHYGLLKTLDTLSLVDGIEADNRYQEMLDRLRSKQSPDGKWLAESVNKPYSGFDFGQKKQPSPWITFLALRILNRSGQMVQAGQAA